MRTTDTISLRGSLEITVFRGGEAVEHWRDDNMIMNAARDALARLLAGSAAGKVIARIAVGTNGVELNPANTGLSNPFVKTLQGYDFPETGRVRFRWRLETAEANGMAIREFGLMCGDGTLFARKVRPAIEKAEDIAIEGAWSIIF